MDKKLLVVVFAFLAAAAAAGAQSLGESSRPPVMDGVIGSEEYSWSQRFQSIRLYLSRTNGRLFAAVEAESEGWVGIGFGSTRMDGAHVFIGYVHAEDSEIAQHLGRGHGHRNSREAVELQYSLRESGGVTVMEISVPEDAFIEAGQDRLELIIACGEGDRTTVYHSYRRGVVVDL